jgi:hypothetical protein
MSDTARDEKKLRVLLLSAGSLLGQNVLDLVERRRDQLQVIGADANPENARLFRCDAAYAIPPVDDGLAFETRFEEIVAAEKPALVLPGRDFDVLFLAGYMARHPRCGFAAPVGALRAAEIMQDKWASFQFAQERRLPFADSLLVGPGVADAAVSAWLQRHPFPVLAKPVSGFGSHGVMLVYAMEQVQLLHRRGTYLLQEFIGEAPDVEPIRRSLEVGIPWFFGVPEEAQYAAQTVISPAGKPGRAFCSRSRMVMGRCEASWRANNAELESLAERYARAFAEVGWRGSLNMQFKRAGDGSFKAHEFNGRMSGSTSARLLLGFDELRLIVGDFLDRELPAICEEESNAPGYVTRTLSDMFVPLDKVQALRATGVWRR